MSEKKKEEQGLVKISSADLAITDRSENREKFFENLETDIDRYDKFEITEEQKNEVLKVYKKYSTGLSAMVPLDCTGSQCPFAESCPYEMQDIAPIGEPCKLEYDMTVFYTRQFMDEFDVDPNDYSEVMLISELVELLIYETRANKILAKPDNAEFVKEIDIVTPKGELGKTEIIHNAWNVKERIKSRRMKILDSLAATRKEKIKIAQMMGEAKSESTVTRTMNDLRNKLADLTRELQKEDADYEVIEPPIQDE